MEKRTIISTKKIIAPLSWTALTLAIVATAFYFLWPVIPGIWPLVVLVVTAIGFLVVGGELLQVVWHTNHIQYVITEEYIERVRTGMAETIVRVPFHTVREVEFDCGVFQKMLGVASIGLWTTTVVTVSDQGASTSKDGIEILWLPLDEARELYEYLAQRCAGSQKQ